MIVIAVIYSLFSYLFPTAFSSQFLSKLRSKYGGSIFTSIRRCETLTKKLQKAKCDTEFLRCCLVHNLTPKFIDIRLWKPSVTSTQKYKEFQRTCLLHEFESRKKQVRQLEKQLCAISCCLEKDLSSIDYVNVKKFLHDAACRVHKRVLSVHQKKV